MISVDSAGDDILYRTLDVTDDSIGEPQTVFDGISADTTRNWTQHCLSVTKARGGSIYVGGWIDNNGENGFWVSSNGSDWTSKASPVEGNEVDRIQFLPASGPDANDCWSIYQDVSANEVSVKVYDASANSWNETAIATGIVEDIGIFQFDSISNHSNDHAFLSIFDAASNTGTTGNLETYDIAGSSDITTKTNITTNHDGVGVVGMMINQQNGSLYVSWIDAGVDGTATGGSTVYKISDDGGDTWGNETALSETFDDLRMVMGGTSIGNDGGRLQSVWFNDDLQDLLTNKLNSIEFSAAAPPAGVGGLITYSDAFVSITNPF